MWLSSSVSSRPPSSPGFYMDHQPLSRDDSIFQRQLLQSYDEAMEAMLYGEALFIGEALSAENPESGKLACLLARALYLDGQAYRAADTLATFINENSSEVASDDLRYLYARCCFDLERFNEAIDALKTVRRAGATEAVSGAALLLLGKCLERVNDKVSAAECYAKCLERCPYMHEAFERLSHLSLEATKLTVPPLRFAQTYVTEKACNQLLSMAPSQDSPTPQGVVPPSVMTSTPTKPPNHLLQSRPPQHPIAKIPSTPPPKGRRALSPPTISKPPPPPVLQFGLCEYMQTVCAAMHALNSFDCNCAVELLHRLPLAQQDTLLVQGMLGKAFAESGKFQEAESCFSQALRLSPSGIVDEFLDSYSSVLWQLKKEAELAHLCTHALRVANRFKCHKLWIAVANAFSLQKDFPAAVKFLARAVQISPRFSYAHTLLGHEYFSMEKFDQAEAAYKQAIDLDPRSYNAYWGLGQMFLRREEFAKAKFNFGKAAEINPKSSTVRYSIGCVSLATGQKDLAYQQWQLAVELNPQNAPALCQKGMLEFSHYRKIGLARETLEKALAIAPREPAVCVMLGQIFAVMPGRRTEAMTMFNTALDLSKGAKDAFNVKKCIEDLDTGGAGWGVAD